MLVVSKELSFHFCILAETHLRNTQLLYLYTISSLNNYVLSARDLFIFGPMFW
jgi:hypothetical protein